MARKRSFQQRLIEFAMGATDEELDMALDTLKAFIDTRKPTKPARAKRSDAGKPRPTRTATSTTTANDVAEVSSSAS